MCLSFLLTASLASFPKLAGAKLAERGFLLGLGLRASRFSTWRASLRFWRLRLVIVLSHGFRFVQRFNGGSQAVRASDGILINGFGPCLVLRRFAAKSACRRLQVPQCGHRRFPFLVNPGHSSKPRLVDVRPLLRSIRLFPDALRRRASMPRQSRRQLPPMQQQSPLS